MFSCLCTCALSSTTCCALACPKGRDLGSASLTLHLRCYWGELEGWHCRNGLKMRTNSEAYGGVSPGLNRRGRGGEHRWLHGRYWAAWTASRIPGGTPPPFLHSCCCAGKFWLLTSQAGGLAAGYAPYPGQLLRLPSYSLFPYGRAPPRLSPQTPKRCS